MAMAMAKAETRMADLEVAQKAEAMAKAEETRRAD